MNVGILVPNYNPRIQSVKIMYCPHRPKTKNKKKDTYYIKLSNIRRKDEEVKKEMEKDLNLSSALETYLTLPSV